MEVTFKGSIEDIADFFSLMQRKLNKQEITSSVNKYQHHDGPCYAHGDSSYSSSISACDTARGKPAVAAGLHCCGAEESVSARSSTSEKCQTTAYN